MKFLGADCADFGCRLCSNGSGMFFLGADCADFGCRLCSNGPGMFFLGADCADRDKDSADCRLQSEHNK